MEPLKILSLGVGVQSTALYYMSSLGIIERCDYAVFADTGREKAGTLWYLEHVLQPWAQANNGIPLMIVREKNLYRDILDAKNSTNNRFASIPAYTKNPDGTVGMLRRQCTNEYKIEQVDRAIRKLYGLEPRKRMPVTYLYKGISLDEIERLSIAPEKWKIQVYPFVGYKTNQLIKGSVEKIESKRMTRLDIINWYHSKNLIVPPKSACTFCPYQSDAAYYDMKMNHPEDWESAVAVDRAIRDSTKMGVKRPAFLHESCVPLEEIDFKPGQPDLWHGECSGGCHT